MNTKIKKFLEFNGKAILFLSIDGQYWVALKPICEALNLNWVRQYMNLKEHKILGQLFANQLMVGADLRSRNMVALPEKYVYGWLFSISSGSGALQEYQMKCYELLYDYFHGTISQRHSILSQKVCDEQELHELEAQLKEDKRFTRMQELHGSIARSGIELKHLTKRVFFSAMQNVLYRPHCGCLFSD
ncbi:hypothetical protein ES708_10588 [subsurface metagenome]